VVPHDFETGATIDRESVLDGLITFGVSGTAGKVRWTANGEVQVVALFVSKQTDHDFLLGLEEWQAVFCLKETIKRVLLQVILQELFTADKADMRQFERQGFASGETQAMEAKDRQTRPETQSLGNPLVGRPVLATWDIRSET
jgi:hypothetical protein